MAETVRHQTPGLPGHLPVVLAVLGGGIALTLGLAAGNPTPSTVAPAVLIIGIAVMLMALARPFGTFLVLAASAIFLMVFELPDGRGLNAFDFLLLPLMVASVIGAARDEALAADRRMTDARHQDLRIATRRLAFSVIAFLAIALLSIVVMGLSGRPAPVANSTIGLIRAVQGLLLFPLGLWWLRSERRIHMTIHAMLAGGIFVAVVNSVAVGLHGVTRAGLTWFVNQSESPVGDPNEAATAMLLLAVLLLVRQSLAHRVRNLVLICLVLGLLVVTFSRSGLLALLTFVALVLPMARRRGLITAVVGLVILLPLVPHDYWQRLARTLIMQRGSFEAYSSMIRIYSWQAALAMFLDHPLLGVGYMGFSSLSNSYNDLRLKLGPAESYYLEMASGVGLIGLTALALVFLRMFQLGRVVQRVAAPGSMGHALARFHTPFIVALLVANLTGDNFVGMVGLAQIALWMALLIRAGHEAVGTPSA